MSWYFVGVYSWNWDCFCILVLMTFSAPKNILNPTDTPTSTNFYQDNSGIHDLHYTYRYLGMRVVSPTVQSSVFRMTIQLGQRIPSQTFISHCYGEGEHPKVKIILTHFNFLEENTSWLSLVKCNIYRKTWHILRHNLEMLMLTLKKYLRSQISGHKTWERTHHFWQINLDQCQIHVSQKVEAWSPLKSSCWTCHPLNHLKLGIISPILCRKKTTKHVETIT